MNGSTTLPASGSSPESGSAISASAKILQDELRLRPTLLAFAAVAAGMASAYAWWHILLVLPLIAWLRDRRSTIVLALFAAAGLMLRPATDTSLVLTSMPVQGEATVVSVPRPGPYGVEADVEAGGKHYVLRTSAKADLAWRDVVRLSGELKPIKEYSDARGAMGIIQMDEPPVVIKKSFVLQRMARDIQQNFSNWVHKSFGSRDASMLDALCFGATADLDSTTRLNLRRAGLSHLVAASGFQVTMLALAFYWMITRFITLPRWMQFALLILLLILYGIATGMKASVIRAIGMAVVFFPAWWVDREPDGLAALGLVGTVNLLFDPRSICDVGFLLSYSAMLGLILFAPHKGKYQRSRVEQLKVHARNLFWASLIAALATLPVVAYVFGEIPLLSLPANLLSVPLVPVATIAALVGWLLDLVIPGLGVLIVQNTSLPLVHFIMNLASFFGSGFRSTYPVPWFSPYVILLAWASVLVWWRPKLREA